MDDMIYLPDQELIIADENGRVYAKFSRKHYELHNYDDFDEALLYPCIGIFRILLDMFRPYSYYGR